MTNEGFFIFAVIVIAAIGGIAFWVLRPHWQDKNKPAADNAAAMPRREPTFGETADRADKSAPVAAAGSAAGGESGAVVSPAAATSAATAAAVTAATAGEKTAPPPATSSSPQQQGTLAAISYTPPSLPTPPESLLLSDICFAVYFYADDKPVPAKLFEQLAAKLERFNLAIYRLLAFDENRGEWQREVSEPHRYWILAVPLADRSGQLNKERMALLEEDVRQFSELHHLHNRFPPTAEAIANAARLDKFCNIVDLVVEWRINLSAEEESGRVNEILTAHNLTREGKRYVYRLDSESIFQVQCPLALDGRRMQSLVFVLDAPKVSSPEQALDDMVKISRQISIAFNAAITDPKGVPVNEARIADIRRQLTILRKQMNDFGVPPGSSTAHLLFS